jgi:hypothetical protein
MNLGLFPPHFSQICQGFANLVYFFKEPTLLCYMAQKPVNYHSEMNLLGRLIVLHSVPLWE